MRWFWAAYQMGAWRDVMDGEMPQPLFRARILEVLAAAPYDWVLEAKGSEGVRPVGLVLGFIVGRAVEPGIEWFPWATTRNQVEGTAAFIKEIGKTHKIMVFASEDTSKFWTKFTQHRMIRRGCKVVDYFSRGEHAMLYYTTGPN